MDIERSKQLSREITMLPLINIIFLLLIFFLIAGTVQKFEVIDVVVPVADSGKILEEGPIVVVLGQYDEVLLNDELIKLSELKPRVMQLLKDSQNPNRLITLKADARMQAERMIGVMNQLRDAGGKNLSLVTQSLS